MTGKRYLEEDNDMNDQGYKVDNAIIMAAGMATRFVPLSTKRPKGLLNVKGEVLIERQLKQLNEAGITDITIVVGHLKEQFYYLKDKFGVNIVENQDYQIYNNPSSLIRVMDKLENTYICSSDNYFTVNPFESFVDRAYYSAAFIPGEADEWGLETDETGLITKIVHNPKDMWCMLGHVFFSGDFSLVFRKLLKEQYDTGDTKVRLWESLYEKNMDKLPLYIRKYENGVILEFDSVNDLVKFDNRYAFSKITDDFLERFDQRFGTK